MNSSPFRLSRTWLPLPNELLNEIALTLPMGWLKKGIKISPVLDCFLGKQLIRIKTETVLNVTKAKLQKIDEDFHKIEDKNLRQKLARELEEFMEFMEKKIENATQKDGAGSGDEKKGRGGMGTRGDGPGHGRKRGKTQQQQSMVAKETFANPNLTEMLKAALVKLLNHRMRPSNRRLADSFIQLPSHYENPQYYPPIEHPMDLKSIQRKIDENKYETIEQMSEDVNLMCENAQLFQNHCPQFYQDSVNLYSVWRGIVETNSKQGDGQQGEGASTSAASATGNNSGTAEGIADKALAPSSSNKSASGTAKGGAGAGNSSSA